MNVTVTIPLRTYSTMNGREHWGAKARRAKQERTLAHFHCPRGLVPPMTVILTRIAPRALDTDNLAASFKAIRDGIADRIGINDRDSRVRWVYEQRTGNPRQYAVQMDFLEVS